MRYTNLRYIHTAEDDSCTYPTLPDWDWGDITPVLIPLLPYLDISQTYCVQGTPPAAQEGSNSFFTCLAGIFPAWEQEEGRSFWERRRDYQGEFLFLAENYSLIAEHQKTERHAKSRCGLAPVFPTKNG